MTSTPSITSKQCRDIVARHGKLTMAGIEQELGIKVPKGNKVKIKVPKKHFGELKKLLRDKGITYVEEYKFHPTRKWKFDLCVPSLSLACEYEGLFSKKSRHTTCTGYTGDASKYNEAAKLGWKVFRYTALNIGNAIQDVEKILNEKFDKA